MQETELEESVVMDESEIDRTLVRMAHQILEQQRVPESGACWHCDAR